MIADLETSKGSKISTGAEFFADVFGEGADVGAGRDMTANSEIWVVVF